MLLDIQRESAYLTLRIQQTGEREGSFRNKAAGSPALINLDAMTLLGLGGSGFDQHTGLGPIDETLAGWAARVRDYANGWGPDDSPDDWAPWVPWLLEADDALVSYPHVDELFATVRQLHGHVMRTAGAEQPPSKQLAKCTSKWEHPGVVPGSGPKVIECKAMIFKRPFVTTVRCQRCGRVYSAIDQLRLNLEASPKSLTVQEVAKVCEVNPITVRVWISSHRLTADAFGKVHSEEVLRWWRKRNHQRARGVGSTTRLG